MTRQQQLLDALQKLLAAIGEPWDIDQDCRFCAGHYDWHEDVCPWWNAQRVLDASTGTERDK